MILSINNLSFSISDGSIVFITFNSLLLVISFDLDILLFILLSFISQLLDNLIKMNDLDLL
jgi:hypothetical protein